jgi:DNA-binding GntR family transcriptional regulator
LAPAAEFLLHNNSDQFFESDRSFHDLIVNNGGNGRLARFLHSINVQVERMRRISALKENRLATSMQEHLAILQAIKSRDIIKAETELRRHIRNIKQSTLEVCRNVWWKSNEIDF